MTNDEAKKPDQSDEKGALTAHFIKSNEFRVIHCDGALIGPSPSGKTMHVTLFSERIPIPILVNYEISSDNAVGKELNRVARHGVVREVEVEVVLSIETAIKVADLIRDKVAELEKLVAGAEKDKSS